MGSQQATQDLWDMAPTPVKLNVLKSMLTNYPDQNTAHELLNGFEYGFNIHYSGTREFHVSKNMKSAETHADELQLKIYQEISLGRIAGPFYTRPMSNIRCSPIGLVPKKQGGWRMICNLSAPQGNSVNDFIDPSLCSVHYTSFDTTISMVQKLGPGALLGKKDITSAFRLLPIRPEDFSLLGFYFDNKYYIDKCLPFGCSIACATFEKFSTALHWIVENQSTHNTLVHYLDDFLFAGPANTCICQNLMGSFDTICKELGVPLSEEKTEGPSTYITFLGLGINTINQTIFIPKDKVDTLKSMIHNVYTRRKVTLKVMQSLVGSLAFVTKAIPAGRAFCRRFYDSLSQGYKKHHYITISKALRDDMEVWLKFLSEFNGTTLFPDMHWSNGDTLHISSDSSGSFGCGVIFGSHWAYLQWPLDWSSEDRRDLTYLELVPVALAIQIWGSKLQSKKIIMHIDNIAVVQIINQKTSKSSRVMSLLRPLLLQLLRFNIQIRCVHIPGPSNTIADAISRFQWQKFRNLAPYADYYPCQIPSEFWNHLKRK